MNEFNKHKIAFSVAFLAVLFAMNPIIKDIFSSGFTVFGTMLSVKHLYYFVSCVFSLSVYAFGIQFLTNKGISFASSTGNLLYALAIAAPILYVFLFAVSLVIEYAGTSLTSTSIHVYISVFSAVISAISSIPIYKFKNWIGEREKEAASEQYAMEESIFMKRAQELLRSKYYDLAVVEAFKAIEVSARKFLFENNMQFKANAWLTNNAIQQALTPELAESLQIIRKARNHAAHGIEPIPADVAKEAIPLASRIVARLSSQQDVS